MSEKELKWLKSKEGFLKIRVIEKDLDMPEGTLSKFISGARNLPVKWEKKVSNWINKFKK